MEKFLHAHALIAETAMAMANDKFEDFARGDKFYADLLKACNGDRKRARNAVVNRLAPMLYEDARVALTNMLKLDGLPQSMKDEIAEALILDNEVRALRPVATDRVVLPPHLQ